MCGIAGVLLAERGREASEATLAAMTRLLAHRGPDANGTWHEGPCGLAHTRLAVIDLSPRGRQPMRSVSGRFVISYNGEIYNHRELRAELEAAGRSFVSTTDTEVILELAEVGGLGALSRLEGMFAFALYDRERREIVLVRDRVGVKPLFYAHGSDGLAFASEPKALPPFVDRGHPEPARIAEYLAFRHLAGGESILPGVRTLEPGHLVVSDGRNLRIERWDLPERRPPARAEDTAGVFAAAVRRQLVSDVPVGIFLSGGVDSAAVAYEARAALPELQSFTVGFDEAAWDETDRAAVVARALGTRAHELRLDEGEYVAGLARATWHLDAPLNHAHSVHLLALSRFARERITVALTGEGSDELFAGYPRHRLFLLSRRLRGMPRSVLRAAARGLRPSHPRLARLLESAASDAATAAALNPAFAPLDEARALAGANDPEAVIAERLDLYREAEEGGASPVEALLAVDQATYMVSLLQRMDRMSMAVGLECRVPLLDEAVVAHARALPVASRIDLFETKKPVRHLARERFGRAFADAPKSGFGVPVGEWLRREGPFSKLVDSLLADGRARRRGWFDVDRAARLLVAHRRAERDESELLWGVACLEIYARVCCDGDGIE